MPGVAGHVGDESSYMLIMGTHTDVNVPGRIRNCYEAPQTELYSLIYYPLILLLRVFPSEIIQDADYEICAIIFTGTMLLQVN